MGVVSPFWAGAMRFGHGVDLLALAHEVGWEGLLSDPEPHLVRAGVAPERVGDWLGAPSWVSSGAVITLADRRYPERLKAIAGPPPVLCIEGDTDWLSQRCWGVVGTRNCTPYGAAVARHLSGALAARGIVVVSGLARGIDGHAHRASLEVGRTVAVVGHGLGHTAPMSHRRLRARIVASGGAIVSGFPDHAAPHPGRFPTRNPWLSGLCEGVVVVEAGSRSGTRITARAAAEQGREVAVVPGPLGAPMSLGCLELIAEGAGVIVDVERFVGEVTDQGLRRADGWLKSVCTGDSVEEVSRRFSIPVSDLLARLSRLEMEGRLVRLPGGRYAPSGDTLVP